jgi:D-ribulokinase
VPDTAAPSFVGLDLGTSGCRAVAIDAQGRPLARAETALPAPQRPGPGRAEQDPELWWTAARETLARLARALRGHPPAAICVDATSATLLLTDPRGRPLGPALMYNDQSSDEAAQEIATLAPADSPARGSSSSLAKLITLATRLAAPLGSLALHQADWVTGRLTGHFGLSDWNNSLKLGFDAERLVWPRWIDALIPVWVSLPRVEAPGTDLGKLDARVAETIGFPAQTRVHAGTTDSTAAAIAAGIARPGDAVTSLGSTLVVKILAERPISAAALGVYSHRHGGLWLAGGASNSGGAVLRQYFSDQEIRDLSRLIDPERITGLDYYPLPGRGERFPRQAPDLEPRLTPRPADPALFLHGLLEGIAAIEAEGYARLAELGAPAPKIVWTCGGGAGNSAWTRIRERRLGVPIRPARHQEAALGAALLALRGPEPSALAGDRPTA